MTHMRTTWAIVGAVLVCVEAQLCFAQTQQPAQTTNPPAEAAASGEDAPLEGASNAAGGGTADAQARARRRMQTTTTATLKIGDKNISMLAAILKADAPDYALIDKLKEGEVLQPTRSQAIKLKTDLPLTFGDVTLKTENVAKGYAGVYSLWIKKTADGWAFVFNQKPDVWGTMYDAAANVGEIKVEHGAPEKTDEGLKFAIEQKDTSGGTIKISWGAHQWSAKFTLAQ